MELACHVCDALAVVSRVVLCALTFWIDLDLSWTVQQVVSRYFLFP